MSTIVLNWGMGADSSAILTRWLLEPESRDFSLDNLVVVTAQTGDEFADTQAAVENHALPLLRQHNVRWVQVARGGLLKADSYVILDDSRQPTRMHREGRYRLFDELLRAGTVPAVQHRRCSQKSKGRVIDAWLDDHITGPFRQVMGFNADEARRISRDSCYGGDNRNAEYPLMQWGWGRERCEVFLRDIYGIDWPKSCCSICPFARGQDHVLERFARHPQEAADALYLEHVALALNPSMTLYANGSLREKLTNDNRDHSRAFALLAQRLAESPWSVYRVRRVYHAKGRADRAVEHLVRGLSQGEAEAWLRAHAGAEAEQFAYSWRAYHHRREPDVYPTIEEMLVAVPSDAHDKARASFETTWRRVSLQLAPVVAA